MTCWKYAWLFFWLGVSATMIGTVVYGHILRGRELKKAATDEAGAVE